MSDIRWTTTDRYGTVRKYKNGLLHCETGPAVIYANGQYEWWMFGSQTLPRSPPQKK